MQAFISPLYIFLQEFGGLGCEGRGRHLNGKIYPK